MYARTCTAYIILLSSLFCVDSTLVIASSKIACEYDTLNINCSPDHALKILKANYGRTSVSVCGLGGDTNCISPNTLNIVKERCNNLQSCSIVANNTVFGDPCINTIKYLEVSYVCMRVNCAENEIKCHDGTCLLNSRVCDGFYDCPGNEDEQSCP